MYLQCKDELFMEDINSILNCGDLPNLYQPEDKAIIMENMLSVAKQMVNISTKYYKFDLLFFHTTLQGRTLDALPSEVYSFYIERIRNQLHLALSFSHLQTSFRKTIHIYPAFLKCCTIDW